MTGRGASPSYRTEVTKPWIAGGLSSTLRSHCPIEHVFHETVGVLGTRIVRRKTDEYLGRVVRSSKGLLMAHITKGMSR
jgi:hypothetical protein